VANGWSDLVDGTNLDHNINISELNATVSNRVFTNTDPYGNKKIGDYTDCANWSSIDEHSAPSGHSVNDDYRWTHNSGGKLFCSYPSQIYCLWQQPYNNDDNSIY
jgi:hypothetical protein